MKYDAIFSRRVLRVFLHKIIQMFVHFSCVNTFDFLLNLSTLSILKPDSIQFLHMNTEVSGQVAPITNSPPPQRVTSLSVTN